MPEIRHLRPQFGTLETWGPPIVVESRPLTQEEKESAIKNRKEVDAYFKEHARAIEKVKSHNYVTVADHRYVSREALSAMIDYAEKLSSEVGETTQIVEWTGAKSHGVTVKDYIAELTERASRQDTAEEEELSEIGVGGTLSKKFKDAAEQSRKYAGGSAPKDTVSPSPGKQDPVANPEEQPVTGSESESSGVEAKGLDMEAIVESAVDRSQADIAILSATPIASTARSWTVAETLKQLDEESKTDDSGSISGMKLKSVLNAVDGGYLTEHDAGSSQEKPRRSSDAPFVAALQRMLDAGRSDSLQAGTEVALTI